MGIEGENIPKIFIFLKIWFPYGMKLILPPSPGGKSVRSFIRTLKSLGLLHGGSVGRMVFARIQPGRIQIDYRRLFHYIRS